MKKQITNLILPLFLMFFISSYSQNEVESIDQAVPSRLFQTDDVLPIELRYSIKEIKKETNDSTYTDSQLRYFDNEQWDSIDVKLRVRGNYRLKECFYPPLKLKFKKSKRKNTLFEDDKKLKLVMPCLIERGNNDNVIKEFLAYKIYEIVSPYHFNTKLVDIKLIEETRKKTREYDLKGFLIEDIDNVVDRYNGKEMKRKVHPLAQEHRNSTRNEFFQFMIGNTDFSTAYSHNHKLMWLNGEVIPIPYDFDICGLVDPSYGVVSQASKTPLPIEKVTERYYRGFKREAHYLERTKVEFLEKRAEVFEMINHYEDQFEDERTFEKVRDFLTEFYDILNDYSDYQRYIVDRARDH